MAQEKKVRLTFPWTDSEGKEHKQNAEVTLPRAEANMLVRGGRAVRVDDKAKPKTQRPSSRRKKPAGSTAPAVKSEETA